MSKKDIPSSPINNLYQNVNSSSSLMKTVVKSTLTGYSVSRGTHTNTCQPQSSACYTNNVVDASKSGVSSYDSRYRLLATRN